MENDGHKHGDTRGVKAPAGERGFTLFLLILSCLSLWASVLLWLEHPGADGPAVIPLSASALMTALCGFELLRGLVLSLKRGERQSMGAAIKCAAALLFGRDLLISLAAVAVYCLLTLAGLPFYVITPLFLWGLMTYLCRGGYLRNLAVTAGATVVIWLIFGLLLGVPMF